jgi:hypothetical protein
MIVEFTKFPYETRYYAHSPAHGWLFDENVICRISDCIKNTFDDVTIYCEDDTYHVNARERYFSLSFTDPADEAFFLIWANDGLVI